MTEVLKAEATIAKLEDARRALIQKAIELAEERNRIAFGAHVEGDAKSRKRLDAINAELATMASEQASVEAALIEATARCNVARAGEALAADRTDALRLREKLAKFRELGMVLDDCFADFKSAAIEMKAVLDEIHNLGQAAPTAQSFKVNCDLAFKTAVQGTPFWSQDFPALGHGQKKTFKSLVDAWSGNIEANIAARLGEKKKDAAA
jgi:hypothetical protein